MACQHAASRQASSHTAGVNSSTVYAAGTMCLFAPAGCKGSHQSAVGATTTQLHSDSIISRSFCNFLFWSFFLTCRARTLNHQGCWPAVVRACAVAHTVVDGPGRVLALGVPSAHICVAVLCVKSRSVCGKLHSFEVGRTKSWKGCGLLTVRSPPARGEGPNVCRVEGSGAAGGTK
jgi:hypothetical protein